MEYVEYVFRTTPTSRRSPGRRRRRHRQVERQTAHTEPRTRQASQHRTPFVGRRRTRNSITFGGEPGAPGIALDITRTRTSGAFLEHYSLETDARTPKKKEKGPAVVLEPRAETDAPAEVVAVEGAEEAHVPRGGVVHREAAVQTLGQPESEAQNETRGSPRRLSDRSSSGCVLAISM